MKEYAINYLLWWYGVRVKEVWAQVVGLGMFFLQYTNTLSMIHNYREPLYQDYTRMGRIIGVTIRSMWILVGGSISAVVFLASLMFFLLVVIFPILVVVQLILGFINVLL